MQGALQMAMGILAAAGASAGWTLITSATSTTHQITIPSDAAIGDIAILVDRARNASGTIAALVPTGWEGPLMDTVGASANPIRVVVSAKKIESGDPGSTITGMNGDSSDAKGMIVLRYSGSAGGVLLGGAPNAEGSTVAPTNQTITISSATPPLVAMATYGGAAAPTEGFSPAEDGSLDDINTILTVKWKIYNIGTPSNHTVTMNDTGSDNVMQSFWLVAEKILFVATSSANQAAAGGPGGSILTISKPSGTVDGNLMISGIGGNSSAANTWTGDTGWTEDADLNEGSCHRIAHKVASSEGSSYDFTCSNNNIAFGGWILSLSNATFDVIGTFNHATGGGALTVPAITPTAGATVYLSLMDQAASATWPDITGWHEIGVYAGANGPSWRLFKRNQISDGTSTGTVSANSSSVSGETSGILFSVRPTT